MTKLARLEVHRDGDRCFLRVLGEVDMSNVSALMTDIEEALPNDVPVVVMDLTGTTYLDSAGVQLLFLVARRLRTRRHQVSIVAPQDGPIRAVLDMVGLSALVSLYERPEDVPALPDDDWPVAP